MTDALFSTYSGLEARLRAVEVITNNLANAQTVGFKRDFAHFLESDESIAVETKVDLASGDLVPTGNALDVAVDGGGFFVIETSSGIRYTRNGSFAVNSDGELVVKDGSRVLSSSNRPITIGDGEIEINDEGSVFVGGSEVGRLRLVDFADAAPLRKEGQQRFAWSGPDTGVTDVAEPRVKSGALEKSNVNAIDEMVRLMAAYREFESVQKALRTTSSEMNTRLIQELGRLS